MARTSLPEDVFDKLSTAPWWLGVAEAAIFWFCGQIFFAPDPETGTGQTIHTLCRYFLDLLAIVALAAAAKSAIRGSTGRRGSKGRTSNLRTGTEAQARLENNVKNKAGGAITLSVVVAALVLFASRNCEKQEPSPTADPRPADSPAADSRATAIAMSADEFFATLNTAASAIKTAQTSVQRDESIAVVTRDAQRLFAEKDLEAAFVIRDVKMHSANSARFTFSDMQTPTFAQQPKNITLTLAGTWDLPISEASARTIVPGQQLILRGVAAYTPANDTLSLFFPRPYALVRVTYFGQQSYVLKGAVITLVPRGYAIRPAPDNHPATDAKKPDVSAPAPMATPQPKPLDSALDAKLNEEKPSVVVRGIVKIGDRRGVLIAGGRTVFSNDVFTTKYKDQVNTWRVVEVTANSARFAPEPPAIP